jgi:alpha-glucosidase (family GH31 glycosyl hydrolase)
MIRHRPLGRGHAYRIEPDQRDPVVPVAGEPLVLGATSTVGDGDVYLELDRGDGLERVRADLSDRDGDRGRVAGGGHLAAAAASVGKQKRRSWRVRLDSLTRDQHLRYRFVGARGATRWFETAVAEWRSNGGEVELGAPSRLADRVPLDTAQWLVSADGVHRVRFGIRLRTGDRVVGFGERFDRLDQRGAVVDTVVFEQYKGQGNRTYLPMPFAHVLGADGAGFGLHVDTGARVRFDVGVSDPDILSVELAVPRDRPAVAIRLYDGSPSEVLAQFLEATGQPALPPAWTFLPWMSSNEWNTQARVLAEVARMEEEGIPAGVVVIEAWSDEQTFTAFRDARYDVHIDAAPHRLADFTFPADGSWPDPKAMVDLLHEKGLRVLLWQIPLLKARPEPGSQLEADRRELVARGLAVRQAGGRPYANRGWWFPGALLPDFTNPDAREWWLAKRRYLVEDVGIDGFKTDGGEHAWGDDLRYADGTTGAETNNRYPVLYGRVYHDLLERAGVVGVTFSRAGFTGSAGVPCHWAGDEDSTWDAFRASILAGVTVGACGVFFWGWDIGGFSGELPSAELYLRAAAMACFCPIMQYHSEFNHHRSPSNDRTPWNVQDRTGDARVVPGYRFLAELRMRLAPYLGREAERSVATGAPLMRALFFDDPGDPRIWDYPLQYRLGGDLLVCPVVEPGVVSTRCYLPAGEWIGLWTGESYGGAQAVEVEAPLGRIPVFVRAEAAAGLRSTLEVNA